MEAKLETSVGIVTFSLSLLAHIAHDIFPFITYIGGVCGAILGIHGVYILVKGWWLKW